MARNHSQVQYMHTLNDDPAYFDGEQIVRSSTRRSLRRLASSRAQIRREQEASTQFRQARGYGELDATHPKCYGYAHVRATSDRINMTAHVG